MRHRLQNFAEAAQVLGRLARKEIVALEAARDWSEGDRDGRR
jgi:hypothetical protein